MVPSEGEIDTELLDTNPKTAFGATKPPLSLSPRTALVHMAMAFKDGAEKYGPYNWREKAVSVMTYMNAAERHHAQFLDGNDYDKKSLVHHLGHAMACYAIILDAMEVGNAVDDRPPKCDTTALLKRLTTTLNAEEVACPTTNLTQADDSLQKKLLRPPKVSLQSNEYREQ